MMKEIVLRIRLLTDEEKKSAWVKGDYLLDWNSPIENDSNKRAVATDGSELGKIIKYIKRQAGDL